MEHTDLLFDVCEGIAYITLNRPHAANALSMDMAKGLLDAALRCQEDPSIRVIVLTGAGTFFCGGGDLKDFASRGEDLPSFLKEVTLYVHQAISRLTRMDPPLIAAVNGSAGGVGMSFACACDIVYAAESARFTSAYTRVGLTPDGGLTYLLPRIVGMKRATELILTNRVLSANEALALGIVTKVIPDAELVAQTNELAAQLASGPTRAFGTVTRLLYRGWTETLETQMENETQAISDMAHTADAHEGIASFLEKRKPGFKGRE